MQHTYSRFAFTIVSSTLNKGKSGKIQLIGQASANGNDDDDDDNDVNGKSGNSEKDGSSEQRAEVSRCSRFCRVGKKKRGQQQHLDAMAVANQRRGAEAPPFTLLDSNGP